MGGLGVEKFRWSLGKISKDKIKLFSCEANCFSIICSECIIIAKEVLFASPTYYLFHQMVSP